MTELPWIKVDRVRLRESRLFDLHTRVLIFDVWELMATTSEYGRLVTPEGKAMSQQAIAEAVPGDVSRNLVGLGKLVETGFFAAGADDVIYDQGMAHDRAVSRTRAENRLGKTKQKQKHKQKPKQPPSSSLTSSSLLGEGMQGEGEIPAALNVPPFRRVWTKWGAYLRQKRVSRTPMTVQAQLKKCEALGPARAAQMLEKSIENGWQGLFPEKGVSRDNTSAARPRAEPGKYDEIEKGAGEARDTASAPGI